MADAQAEKEAKCECRPGDRLADCNLYRAASDDGCGPVEMDGHSPATSPDCDYAPDGPDLAEIRRHLAQCEDLWLWHEGDTERRAGYGGHMSQMLARLPLDGETRDMKASIERLIADLRTLVDRG